MEGKVLWHYRPPAEGDELAKALAEVETS